MFSFTLQVKSDGYRRTRSTRVFLCASSPDESGREALDWCLEALVQDGDELIVCRGVDEDVLGVCFILKYAFRNVVNISTDKDHDIVREEARDLMRSIQAKSVEYDSDRKVSIMFSLLPPSLLAPTTALSYPRIHPWPDNGHDRPAHRALPSRQPRRRHARQAQQNVDVYVTRCVPTFSPRVP